MRSSFKIIIPLFFVVLLAFGFTSTSFADKNIGNPAFAVPPRLRGRVDFWHAIFTRYGKYQKVVHHRRYPQIAFKILDFSKAANELSPNAYDNLVKDVEEQKVQEIRKIIQHLATGAEPRTSMEMHIVEQMKFLPGGLNKYKDIIANPDWIRTQTGIKEKCQEAVERSGKYIKVIEDIFVREEGLPVELTRLPFIESSFNFTAYSSVGAAGIWQFMPSTARKYMTVGASIDERLDPFIATRAAAKYLKQAYRSLDDWGLAVTSYNHGVGGVKKKMKEASSSNIVELIERTYGESVFGFASQNFWPEFLAAVKIMRDPKRYYPDIQMEPAINAREYRISHPTFLNQAAKEHGVSTDALLSVNYAILAPVATGKRPLPTGYILRVPTGGTRILPVVTPTAIPVVQKKTSANQKSKISKKNEKSTSKKVVSPQKKKTSRTITVKNGQTLSSISKVYGVRIDQLKRLNGLKSNNLKAGQKLKID
jgi:membrane-bound lytic murein transglycosylase D